VRSWLKKRKKRFFVLVLAPTLPSGAPWILRTPLGQTVSPAQFMVASISITWHAHCNTRRPSSSPQDSALGGLGCNWVSSSLRNTWLLSSTLIFESLWHNKIFSYTNIFFKNKAVAVCGGAHLEFLLLRRQSSEGSSFEASWGKGFKRPHLNK
jgi:hypothetical protein